MDPVEKQLTELKAVVDKALDWLATQPAHMVFAFVLAVLFPYDETAHSKALDQDGDSREEKWAWDQGIIYGPLLRAWALNQATGGKGLPPWIASLLRDLFKVQLP